MVNLLISWEGLVGMKGKVRKNEKMKTMKNELQWQDICDSNIIKPQMLISLSLSQLLFFINYKLWELSLNDNCRLAKSIFLNTEKMFALNFVCDMLFVLLKHVVNRNAKPCYMC